MVTCDICDKKIRGINNVPTSFATNIIRDICSVCDKNLCIEINKIDNDLLKYRKDKISDVIEKLKLDNKDK